MQFLRERRRAVLVDAGTRILDRERPAVRVPPPVQSPGHGHTALSRVLDGVEGELSLLVAGFETGQIEQVGEHVVQRRHALPEHVGGLHAARACALKQRRGPFDDGDAAAQVVRGRAPRLGPRPLERLHGGERRFEIVDMPGRLALVEAPVLRGAAGDPVGAELHPGAANGRHHAGLELGMAVGVAFQLVRDADLQVCPLADQLPQLIALLPALQAVARTCRCRRAPRAGLDRGSAGARRR
ncbi:MAG TPA: hypothetical protein VEO54_11720 [Thermoanaerobaculia bacterium]|nr:hypothetical protein [Thermoanaerobaculia bacterium]